MEMTRKFYYPDIKYDTAYGRQAVGELAELLGSMYEPDEIPGMVRNALNDPRVRLIDALRSVADKIDTDFTVLDAFDEDFKDRDAVPRDVLSQIRGYKANDELMNDCRLSGYVMAYLLKDMNIMTAGVSNYGYEKILSPVHLAVVIENKMLPMREGDNKINVIHFGAGRSSIRTYRSLAEAGKKIFPVSPENVGLLEREVSHNYEPYLRSLEQLASGGGKVNPRILGIIERLIRLGR